MHLDKFNCLCLVDLDLRRVDMGLYMLLPNSVQVWCAVSMVAVRLLRRSWLVGCVAQFAESRSLAGELTLSCARPAADR